MDEIVTDKAISRWPLLLGVAIALGLFFYFLEPILMPFVVGTRIGYLGDPLVDMLERHRINRTVSVVLVFAMFTAPIFAYPVEIIGLKKIISVLLIAVRPTRPNFAYFFIACFKYLSFSNSL